MKDDPHSIRQRLSVKIKFSGQALQLEKAVLAYGRRYVAIKRPSGYRLGTRRQCFYNAGRLADQNRGTYVEGFALSRNGGGPVHHAWATPDGSNAVDVTWRTPPEDCEYFGIPFSKDVLERSITRTGHWGPLLDPDDPDELQRVLTDAGFVPVN